MAETLLSFGIQKLWDLIARESDRLKGIDEQLSVLKSDLNLLRSFLKDADAKKHTFASVKNCVDEIKEIVFDTEDIIEKFLINEERKKTSGIMTRMRRLSCVIVDRKEISSEMRGINKRISKVILDMQNFGVQQIIINGSEYSHPLQERQREIRKTFPSIYENNLVGLGENVMKLVGYLVEEDSIQMVSITEMGGIGKTTLARQVFNHEMIKNHFKGLSWVCVSQQFTRKYVWQTILRKLKPTDKVLKMTEDELQENLVRVLETQKALIVLDDIWREEDWDRIKPMFPRGKGWKVLLTSHNEGVALRAHLACFTFKPDFLNLDESWTLFQKIAFPRENTTSECKIDEEMEDMGKQMIKRCGGLPLAVKVLGGLLAEQYTLHEWKGIYENIKSHIVGGTSFNDRNINSVYHILSLSFEELPAYLKHCFLYLAHFPEDYEIDVGNLSCYWAAEGFPRPRCYDGVTTRNVADGYIEELVRRNMVISEREVGTSRFETCHLHDMMREVCLLKAEEENFVQLFHSAISTVEESKSRRLAIQCSNNTSDDEYRGMENAKLRSLMFIKKFTWKLSRSNFCFKRLPLMRVLDLSRADFQGGELPSSIGNLVHLKYLSLYMAHVTHLPSSIKNLKLLIYLNLCVHKESSLYIPNFFKEMEKLAYLFLPLRMHETVKMELDNLVNLETLENFSVEHGSVRDLEVMARLKALSISIRGGCTVETLSSSLSKLQHLEKLTISFYRMYASKNDRKGFVLDCVHLEQLKLNIYMPMLPDGQHFPSHLRNISLTECCLKEDPMPILEKLLHLNEVNLLYKSFPGRNMVCSSGGFPQLQKLNLVGLENWEEWTLEEGSMPILHILTVRNCQKLKELPDGLQFVISLEELTVISAEREFSKNLSEGGKDFYKVQHIPLLKVN